MKMKSGILALMVIVLSSLGSMALADNNFSRELLNVAKPGATVAFSNPRAGWVFFRSGNVDSELEVKGVEARKVKLIRGEGFAELPAGDYKVSGANAGLVIRTAPELLFYTMAGDFNFPANMECTIPEAKTPYGRAGMFIYHWKYLRDKILPSFNVVYNNSGADHPALDVWRSEGKKVVVQGIVYGNKQDQAAWSKILSASRNDGIMADEFILPVADPKKTGREFGYLTPGVGFDAATLEAVRVVGKQAQKNNGRFYAWIGVPWDSHTDDVKPLLDALRKVDGYLLWEAYTYSRNYQQELNYRILDRTKGFIKADPKAFQAILVAPATMEFSDNNATVDFKVWLDRQLNVMANNADFAGIRGLSFWASLYTNPEIMRWYAALLRHYALDGNKRMLSEHYGYKLEPGILQNPEWKAGLKYWKVNAASANSIVIRPKEQWGFNSGYFPRSQELLLGMKRVNGAVNSISQTLKNLKQGELYSLMTLVTAPGRTATEKYAVNFALSNCQIVDCRLRIMLDYTPSAATNQQCWNAYDIVFKYNGGGDAVLTANDVTGTGAGPGADAVTPAEILIDSIRIAPYFSTEK